MLPLRKGGWCEPQVIYRRLRNFIAGIALFVFLPDFATNFASATHLLNVLKQVSFLSILAIASTFALITAELDLPLPMSAVWQR